MKKLSLLVLVAMLLSLVLTACGEEHSHVFGDAWQTDATSHWNKAVCEHTSEIANKADHADTNGDGICDTCKYVMHTHTYATEWSVDETNHWNAASCAHTAEVSNKAAHTDVNNDKICDVCAYDYAHTHTYSEEWTYDANNHWNAASCGCTVAPKNVATHADENNDGACDTCGHIESLNHTYATEWTYDEENHWHKATCGHDVTSEKVAHTTNAAGICSECGYNSGTLDITNLTLAEAIEIGLITKSGVSGIVNETVYSDLLNSEKTVVYEFADGFFYSASDFTQSVWSDWDGDWYNDSFNVKSYYYLLDDGSVWSVIDEGDGATKNPNELTSDVFNGYYFDGSFFNYSIEATYGVEEFIYNIYTSASEKATFVDISAETSASAEMTVYAFSYAEIVGSDLVEYSVAFALNPDTYYVEKVEMVATTYAIYDEEGNILTTTVWDEDWNEVVVPVATLTFDEENALTEYSIADGYYSSKTSSMSIEQSNVPLDDMYSPEHVAAKYFELYLKTWNDETFEEEYVKVDGTLNAEVGNALSIVAQNFLPKSANFAFDTILILDEDGEPVDWMTEYGFFSTDSGNIDITFTKAGEYTFTFKSTFYEVTVDFVVTAPAVSEINPTVNGEIANDTTVFIGESTIIGAEVNQYANDEFTATITDGDTAIGTLNLDDSGDYVFTATAAGTWTITIVSAENAEITATLTLTVKELTPVDVETFFNNTYKGSDDFGWFEMTVVFHPSEEDVTVGTVDVTLSSSFDGDTTVTYNYTYNVETRNLKLTFEGGFDMLGVTLSINGDAKLVGDHMGNKFNLEVSTGDEEEEEINEQFFVDKTFSAEGENGTVWYLSFTTYDGVTFIGTLSDTIMGRPTNGFSFTYTVEAQQNLFGQTEYFIIVTIDGEILGTPPTIVEMVYLESLGKIIVVDDTYTNYYFAEYNPFA